MADEYFDYDHEYNFRDRDILLIGPVVTEMRGSFDRFWGSPLSVPVEDLLKGSRESLTEEKIAALYGELHRYAEDPANFAPQVRKALEEIPARFGEILAGMVWDDVDFICDLPGKNDGEAGLKGGGETTRRLVEEIKNAKKSITLQSPYLVMPEEGIALFEGLVRKGVRVRISTNSLPSTDNILAFSGYSKKRRRLVEAGIEIYEYKPRPAVMKELIERYEEMEKKPPLFAIHAKTLVIDGETLYIGTFNLDPRSVNLNTEVGAVMRNRRIAAGVEGNIEADMAPENSWPAHIRDADGQSSAFKRMKVGLLKLLPLEPVL